MSCSSQGEGCPGPSDPGLCGLGGLSDLSFWREFQPENLFVEVNVFTNDASRYDEATGDFYAVSRLMDHSSPNITLRYVAQTNAEKHKVADALNGILKGKKEEKKTDSRESNVQSQPPVGDTGGIIETHVSPAAKTCGTSDIPQYPPKEISRNLKLVKSNG